jgi:hypothetical protein
MRRSSTGIGQPRNRADANIENFRNVAGLLAFGDALARFLDLVGRAPVWLGCCWFAASASDPTQLSPHLRRSVVSQFEFLSSCEIACQSMPKKAPNAPHPAGFMIGWKKSSSGMQSPPLRRRQRKGEIQQERPQALQRVLGIKEAPYF